MSTAFRMSPELEKLVQAACDSVGKSRSEIIRLALEKYCLELTKEKQLSWYDVLKSSDFKPIRSGRSDLSTNKELLRKRIVERAKRRSD